MVSNKDKQAKAKWNKQLLYKFCDICVEAVLKGLRPGTHFTRDGWNQVAEDFKKETEVNFDKAQLKNKCDAVKREWRLWKDLIGKETGLGWNPNKQTIDASDSWWDEKIKDCIGAIDGIHIHACILVDDQIPFIGRKGIPTQNVMVVCNFEMLFTFVLAGWKGTAHDARIFSTAISNPKFNFPHPPLGKYYLVDAAYAHMPGYLGPFKKTRYHLP